MRKKKWVLRTFVVAVAFACIAVPLMTSYAASNTNSAKLYGTVIETSLMTNTVSNGIQRQFEEQIRLINSCYKRAYSDEKISDELYLTVQEFLEEEEKIFAAENSMEVLEELPENYKNLVFEYCDLCRENLAHIIMSKVESGQFKTSRELKDAVNSYFEECNRDMEFLQKEMLMYGINQDLIIKETEFPYLNAKG